MSKTRSAFTTVRSEGGLLPPDLLSKVAAGQVDGLDAQRDYHLAPNERLNEAVSRSWNRLQAVWVSFQDALRKLPDNAPATSETRERWLLIVCQELGFGRLQPGRSLEVGGRNYPISHLWESVPVHLVGARVSLDHRTPGQIGAARTSPHGLVQELLNASEDYLWGIVSNGLILRILRDNVAMTRQAFLEFDLEEMMDGQVYSDFALLWLVVHESRFEGKPADCWLERWSKEAQQAGVRALDHLREGVEQAISSLGRGFLSHPANGGLRDRLSSGKLDAQEYYRQVLRMVYRLIFLFVAEDRELLLLTGADAHAKETYRRFYSVDRLRRLADQRRGATLHGDLWEGLRVVIEALGSEGGCSALGLPALGSFLWSESAINAFVGYNLANRDLLRAVASLAFVTDGKVRRQVDYRNLGPEELGSVYESLLERHPRIDLEAGSFELATVSGNERKTTGSYYTPTSLISCLLDSALDPVLDEAARHRDPDQAILGLRVVDPACGSGHFLIAAAHRIARRLAAIRSGDDEPSPEQVRHALRDVISHCMYGVDLNPMAVELCKVSLWIEALDPGRPLSFLDQHIQCGHSLIGVTSETMAAGIPDEAFNTVAGDNRKYAAVLRKRNKSEREGQTSFLFEDAAMRRLHTPVIKGLVELDRLTDDSIDALHEKERQYAELVGSSDLVKAKLVADAWCAAFVAVKRPDEPAITEEVRRRLAIDANSVPTAIRKRVEALAGEYKFFHWQIVFGEVFEERSGFDVVLGNPPWERVRLQEQEFFAASDPDIASATGPKRKQLITLLQQSNPRLEDEYRAALRRSEAISHFLHDSGRYPLCGRGDINTYAVFAETMRSLIARSGYAGIIVPTGLATDDTTKDFFASLVEDAGLASLYDFENREKQFPEIDSRVKFCLLTMTGRDKHVAAARFVFFAHKVEDLLEKDRRFELTGEDFRLLNPNTRTCPIFRTQRDADMVKAIQSRIPHLLVRNPATGNAWAPRFRRVFDVAAPKDRSRLATRDELDGDGWKLDGNTFLRGDERYLPVYAAKMIAQYDHRAAEVVTSARAMVRPAQPHLLSPADHVSIENRALPGLWVREKEVVAELNDHWNGRWLACWQDVTSATNERTVVAAVLPFCGTDFTLRLFLPQVTPRHLSALLVSCANSFVFDYVARTKINGLHLADYIMEQLPIPAPSTFERPCPWAQGVTILQWIVPRVLELSYTSFDLAPFAVDCGWTGPPFRWDDGRRQLMRSELDGAFFHLFGMARDEVDYIMETFPIIKRKEMTSQGHFHTKRLILEQYDAMAEAIRNGIPYKTVLDPPPADPSVSHRGANLSASTKSDRQEFLEEA